MDLAEAWEAHAQEWIAWARAPGLDGFWDGTWPLLRSVLPAPAGLVIDLGCGEGRVGRQLLELGYEVVGIEQSPTLAGAVSTGDPSFPVIRADAAALPLFPGSAALVVACMLLIDVDDLDGTVREAAQALRAGGDLCIAIVHPFDSAQDVAAVGTDDVLVTEAYLESRRYEVQIEREGLGMTFVSMHRPLSTYVSALSRAGLAVTAMEESGERLVPWLLVLRASKVTAQ